jgi:hypothetical protein
MAHKGVSGLSIAVGRSKLPFCSLFYVKRVFLLFFTSIAKHYVFALLEAHVGSENYAV